MALDAAGISCFSTPTENEFTLILHKVQQHLAAGGQHSNLPHANQLWMQVGFALFRELRKSFHCLEVYPQATVRAVGAGSIHKFKAGAVHAQLIAASAHTGWPNSVAGEPMLDEISWGSAHDQLDAYLAAWVAALDESNRISFGLPPDDVIWIPRVRQSHAIGQLAAVSTSTITTPGIITTDRSRQCPACNYRFKVFPFGWDAHAAHQCSGLFATDKEERKREYKHRFSHLFKQ